MSKCFKHFKYTMIHKYWVMKYCFEEKRFIQGILHDWTKFMPLTEFIPYANYFFGNPDKLAFDAAWNHHQNSNKHHWHYWLSVNYEGGLKPLPMPIKYVVEMLCDWRAAGKAKGTSNGSWDGAMNWYVSNRHNMILHSETKKIVEAILYAKCKKRVED